MKAELKIEYDPENPDDIHFVNRLMKSDRCYSVLWDIKENIRSIYKYSEDGKEIEIMEKFMNFVNHLLVDNGINIEEDYS